MDHPSIAQIWLLRLVGLCLLVGPGCGLTGLVSPQPPIEGAGSLPGPLPNPLVVPSTDREFVWNQVVDTVDNYFEIAHEQRVRLVGDVLTEGRIETLPQIGATMFEPWRKDSTPGLERWHSTLQSVRRRAEVRVTPVSAGYQVQVAVFKELEDLDRPEHATVGRSITRHDGSLVRGGNVIRQGPATLGWIPLGRDVSLEQTILAQLHARMVHVEAPPPVQVLH